MWNGDYGWHGFGMGLWGLLLWLLLILVLALVLKAILPGRGGKPDQSALDILKERYARGEIDDAEFSKKRQMLE